MREDIELLEAGDKEDAKWKGFEPTFHSYETVENPDRKWYQFWKPRFVLARRKVDSAQYRKVGKTVEFKIEVTNKT